ncbi:hypothetical protein PG984_012320 [Apiospora sp. TS-2023a]
MLPPPVSVLMAWRLLVRSQSASGEMANRSVNGILQSVCLLADIFGYESLDLVLVSGYGLGILFCDVLVRFLMYWLAPDDHAAVLGHDLGNRPCIAPESNPDDEDAARKIRLANEEPSEICRAHPLHFTFFRLATAAVHSSSSTESVEAFASTHSYALWMQPYLNTAATGAANDGPPQEEEVFGRTVVTQVTQNPDSSRLPITMVTQNRHRAPSPSRRSHRVTTTTVWISSSTRATTLYRHIASASASTWQYAIDSGQERSDGMPALPFIRIFFPRERIADCNDPSRNPNGHLLLLQL